jgi:hypothetical protein
MRDPCLIDLGDAVVSSCCGHGVDRRATVCFSDGREALHGADALAYFAEHGCAPHGSHEERARNTV